MDEGQDILAKKKREVLENYRKNAVKRKAQIERNRYYYNYIGHILKFLVEPEKKVLLLKSDLGDFLDAVKPKIGVGLDYCEELANFAKEKYPQYRFMRADFEALPMSEVFDYVLLVNLIDDIVDVEKHFTELHKVSNERTRIIIVNHNFLWYPLIKAGEKLGLKMKQPALNWVSLSDISNILHLAGFEIIKQEHEVIFPKYIPVISRFLNRFIAKIPLINRLCFLQVLVAKKISSPKDPHAYSVSVIIPCKNERENIEGAVMRVPKMGKGTELIFIDDKSDDGTGDEVRKCIKRYPNKNIKLFLGPGVSKAKAVWEGFSHASGDILMILDADLTVLPEELPYFYNALIQGRGEFINGSRMVYPMEQDAMRPFNIIGNKFFSVVFSYLLGRPIKDTLCGTKVFWRADYERMRQFFHTWGTEDRWGDYELLFSASKINLEIIDVPVHYVSRVYGETKMKKRLYNGVVMLKMCVAAFRKLKLM